MQLQRKVGRNNIMFLLEETLGRDKGTSGCHGLFEIPFINFSKLRHLIFCGPRRAIFLIVLPYPQGQVPFPFRAVGPKIVYA